MAGIKRHGDDCMMLFGKRFNHVHEWLDQYARFFNVHEFLDYHRTFLHNKFGVEYIKEKWGPKAEKAARIHLLRDQEWMILRGGDLDNYTEEELWKMCNKALMYFNDFEGMGPKVYHVRQFDNLVKLKNLNKDNGGILWQRKKE